MQIENKALISDPHLDPGFRSHPDSLPPMPASHWSKFQCRPLIGWPSIVVKMTIPNKSTSQNHINIGRCSYSTICW